MSRHQGYIQPIVVEQRGTHLDIVTAAARASILAYHHAPEAPTWQPWLDGRFAKTVRRARTGPFSRLAGRSPVLVGVGEANALGYVPVATDEMPPELAKLQVSGLDMPRTPPQGSSGAAGPVTVVLNTGAGMTTGKAAAQAAHALFMWALTHDIDPDWWASGCPCRVTEVDNDAFEHLAVTTDAVVVADAGFTEVAPGTRTALAHTT